MADVLQGWQADPTGRHEARYFTDGHSTSLVSDGGKESVDELPAPPAPLDDNGQESQSLVGTEGGVRWKVDPAGRRQIDPDGNMQGWHPDPDRRYVERWFVDNEPTTRVRNADDQWHQDSTSAYRFVFVEPGPMPGAAYEGNIAQRVSSMDQISGRTRSEIVGALGQANRVDDTTSSRTVLTWKNDRSDVPHWHFDFVFDENDLCRGVKGTSIPPSVRPQLRRPHHRLRSERVPMG